MSLPLSFFSFILLLSPTLGCNSRSYSLFLFLPSSSPIFSRLQPSPLSAERNMRTAATAYPLPSAACLLFFLVPNGNDCYSLLLSFFSFFLLLPSPLDCSFLPLGSLVFLPSGRFRRGAAISFFSKELLPPHTHLLYILPFHYCLYSTFLSYETPRLFGGADKRFSRLSETKSSLSLYNHARR